MPPVLDVDRLTVGLDAPRTACITFLLEASACVAIHGPSGCGKTTLLRGIARLVPTVEGTVRLDGEIPVASETPAFRRRVVYVAQRPTMLDGTVEENLRRPFDYRGTTDTFDRSRAAAELSAVGLPDDILKRSARELSVGEQQRVALIRATLVKPAVLLLDEPTSALDAESVTKLEAIIQSEQRRGVGIVLVTHDDEQIRRFDATVVEVVPS